MSYRYTRQMLMSPLPYSTRGTRSYFCGLSFIVPHVGNCHAEPGTCHQSPVRFFRLPTSLLSSALTTRPSLLPSSGILAIRQLGTTLVPIPRRSTYSNLRALSGIVTVWPPLPVRRKPCSSNTGTQHCSPYARTVP